MLDQVVGEVMALPSRRPIAGLGERTATSELEQGPSPGLGASSEESWAMGESLTQREFVDEEGIGVVKSFFGREDNDVTCAKKYRLILCQQPR